MTRAPVRVAIRPHNQPSERPAGQRKKRLRRQAWARARIRKAVEGLHRDEAPLGALNYGQTIRVRRDAETSTVAPMHESLL
jgi:hypothetical protein